MNFPIKIPDHGLKPEQFFVLAVFDNLNMYLKIPVIGCSQYFSLVFKWHKNQSSVRITSCGWANCSSRDAYDNLFAILSSFTEIDQIAIRDLKNMEIENRDWSIHSSYLQIKNLFQLNNMCHVCISEIQRYSDDLFVS